MGYDLIPRDKKIKTLSIGAFMWPIILQETGMGYVLGYGGGRVPASYVYKPRNNGASPVSNDGYSVTSYEAKAMASVAHGFVSVNRFINKEWDALTPEQREHDLNYKQLHNGQPLYKQPWHEDRLKQIEQIAKFLEKSKGFKIK